MRKIKAFTVRCGDEEYNIKSFPLLVQPRTYVLATSV